MTWSESDGEKENQGGVSESTERASLVAFLAPAPRSKSGAPPTAGPPTLAKFLAPAPRAKRPTDPPPAPSGAPDTTPASPKAEADPPAPVQSFDPFWAPPVARSRSSDAPSAPRSHSSDTPSSTIPPGVPAEEPEEPSAPAETEAIAQPLSRAHRPLPAPPRMPRPVEAVPFPASPTIEEDEPPPTSSVLLALSASFQVPSDAPTLESAVAAPTATPTSLAPTAYDTRTEPPARVDGAADFASDEALLHSVGARQRPLLARPSVRAALAIATVLAVAVFVLRARKTGAPPLLGAGASASMGQAMVAPGGEPTVLPELAVEQEPKAPVPIDEALSRDLQRQARDLLTAGQIPEGVALARRAIAANPRDGDSYILLAAGLQDLGRWDEARNIFSRCVTSSNGPASAECTYFATQGQ